MTPTERRYMRLQDMGCICCAMERLPVEPADMHHIVDKGYRKHSGGNKATLPLCPWHHRGQPRDGFSEDTAKLAYGPSLKLHKRQFIQRYGTERELLAEVDRRIESMEKAA